MAARLTEAQIQTTVMQHLRSRGRPDLIYLHVPNGGAHQRSVVQRMQNKRLGVQKGAPDILLYSDGNLYCLELKTERGRPSKAQLEMMDRFIRNGAETFIARGLDEALMFLEQHELIR